MEEVELNKAFIYGQAHIDLFKDSYYNVRYSDSEKP